MLIKLYLSNHSMNQFKSICFEIFFLNKTNFFRKKIKRKNQIRYHFSFERSAKSQIELLDQLNLTKSTSNLIRLET